MLVWLLVVGFTIFGQVSAPYRFVGQGEATNASYGQDFTSGNVLIASRECGGENKGSGSNFLDKRSSLQLAAIIES